MAKQNSWIIVNFLTLFDFHKSQQGFAIGNGLTNPAIQYPAYPDYALENGVITKAEHDQISKSIPDCEQAAKTCGTNQLSSFPFITDAHTPL